MNENPREKKTLRLSHVFKQNMSKQRFLSFLVIHHHGNLEKQNA
jgi:hypothetical protein